MARLIRGLLLHSGATGINVESISSFSSQPRFLVPAAKMATGGAAQQDFQKEKERLANLSLEERRKSYFCGDKYTPVSQIQTWREYFNEHQKTLTEKVSEKDMKQFASEHQEMIGDKSGQLADKVSLYRGDITKLELDCVVNAANESLLGGGGVDGAIHRGAGGQLLDECRTLNGCKTGQSKITGGYKLPSKSVVHTVGPIGEKPELLQSCYDTSLNVMAKNNYRTIAFPCISTGIYGYPSQNAAPVAIKAVRKFIEGHPDQVDRVIFCLFLEKDVEVYERLMQMFFPVKSESSAKTD